MYRCLSLRSHYINPSTREAIDKSKVIISTTTSHTLALVGAAVGDEVSEETLGGCVERIFNVNGASQSVTASCHTCHLLRHPFGVQAVSLRQSRDGLRTTPGIQMRL